MERTHPYGPRWENRARDLETWFSNSVATIVAVAAVAAGVIGMLVAFGYISTTQNTPFENGIVWMAGGLILAISATVFRREHHVVDPGSSALMRPEYRPDDRDRMTVPPHTH